VARGERGCGNVFELEGLVGGVEDGCFHLVAPRGDRFFPGLLSMRS
jgi:hypothetical protein